MDGKILEKRTVKRTKMVVALKVLKAQPEAQDQQFIAHTLDISSVGARVGAVRELIQPGSVVTVQRKQTRAQCRVMWSRQMASGEIQLGIEFLGRNPQLWGIELEDDCAGVWLSSAER